MLHKAYVQNLYVVLCVVYIFVNRNVNTQVQYNNVFSSSHNTMYTNHFFDALLRL